MHITSLGLTDIGPFSTFRTDISGTMIGVTGKNGAGKSTILRSIGYAVSGDSIKLGRPYAVRIGSSGPHQPGVTLGFDSFDGRSVVVGRWLPHGKVRGKHRLTVDDDVLTTDEDVTTWMEKELGVGIAATSEIMFVPQGCLTDVVTAPPAKRADILQKVFGLEAASRGYKAAVEHLGSLPSPVDPDAALAAHHNLLELEGRLSAVINEGLGLPDVDEELLTLSRQVIAQSKRLESLTTVRGRVIDESAAMRERLERTDPIRPTDQEIERARLLVDDAERHQKELEQYNAAHRLVVDAETRLDDLNNQLPEHPWPRPEPSERLLDLDSRVYAFKAIIASKTETTCPVCSGHFVATDQVRAESSALLDERNTLSLEFTKQLTHYSEQMKRHELHIAEYESAEEDLNRLKKRLVTPGTNPNITAADARKAHLLLQRASDAADTAIIDRKRCQDRLVRLESELSDIDKECAEGQDAHTVQCAIDFVKWAEGVSDQRRSVEARTMVLEQSIASARQLYDRIDATRRASDALTGHRKVVTELIETLHRDAAPAEAAAAAMIGLGGAINSRLAQLASDYRVKIDASGDVEAVFHDGSPSRPASLLSPGQQMVLALSWRVAIVDRYSPRAGLICLDEPTTGLDEARILALRSALDAWRAADDGMQFVIVTHDRRLSGAFDQRIDL